MSGLPGALWPWGSDGEYPPAAPYVERDDELDTFATDEDAAAAIAAAVGGLVVLVPVWREDDSQRRQPAVYPWPTTPCRWWALCDQDATHTLSHPILGEVPICDRCQTKYDAL